MLKICEKFASLLRSYQNSRYLAESFPQILNPSLFMESLISAISVALQREILGEAWVVQHIRHFTGSGQVSELFSKMC